MSATATPSVDSIDIHVPCLACGYDLFATSRSGVCPECGGEIAHSLSVGRIYRSAAHGVVARKMATLLLVSSCCAGLCPASCLLAMSLENGFGAMTMTAVFIACAVTAGLAEVARRQISSMTSTSPSNGAPLVADWIAAGGLALINLGAYLHVLRAGDGPVWTPIGIGFFLLMITAWRAAPTWLAHADLAQTLRRRGLARFLSFVGWSKAVYETIWLFCCAAAIGFLWLRVESAGIVLAYAAGFGLFGFAGIWLMMIGAHAGLLIHIRKTTAAPSI